MKKLLKCFTKNNHNWKSNTAKRWYNGSNKEKPKDKIEDVDQKIPDTSKFIETREFNRLTEINVNPSFTHENVVIVFTLNYTGFALKDCLFRAAKLTKNADPDKSSYSLYGIVFVSYCFL